MASHARINSTDERRRVAIPRRSTKGPLDEDDDPLSPPPRSPAPDPRRSPIIATAPTLPPKDFSFLQDPSAYHILPASNVPPPFLNAPNTPSVSSPIETLLLTGHYRLAAIAAARNLVTSTPPTDHTTLFHLLHVRLACLCLVSEHALAAQEAKVFGDLNSTFYHADEGQAGARRGTHLVPWELRLLVVKLAALGYGEWRKAVMGYYELARECREHILRPADSREDGESRTWRTRLRDCGIRVANALIEMGDYEAAGRHLASLRTAESDASTSGDAKAAQSELAAIETLVWLRLGDLSAARRTLSSLTPSPDSHSELSSDLTTETLTALTTLTTSPALATPLFTALHTAHPANPMIAQNLAVCFLYSGRVAEARVLLQDLASGQSAPFHALLFNLCTVYELCGERSEERKRGVVESAAGRKGGEGVGWEWRTADFKL